MNLIVIDDEPIQHFIMERMLARYVSTPNDYITYSNNAVEVLAFLDKNKEDVDKLPDIIFLDLNMPIMNGWDFLENYKRIQQKVAKPIMIYVISSSIDPGDISRSKKYMSVKDYIIKPMTRLALKKIFDAGIDSTEIN
ncbi:response regulator [Mucilaginibacter sp. FT3.2]|uniref:response regulator n=1 Tax=Mucilaginibacter sp. FT3.2 TaxID=2723090 RepID=UPI0016203285|nr:two-component SAPR family response regulator [Mucilaginibacter sp. FT3.2]